MLRFTIMFFRLVRILWRLNSFSKSRLEDVYKRQFILLLSAYSISPPTVGSIKRSAAYRFHRNFTYPLSDLIACDVFTLGRWLVGSIIIFRAGHCHDRSHPQFAAFRCSSPRRICTWCLSILLSRNNENISPSTIHPEKIGQWNTLKAHFEKIFLFLHKIQFLFLCYMLISYQNTGENRFRD